MCIGKILFAVIFGSFVACSEKSMFLFFFLLLFLSTGRIWLFLKSLCHVRDTVVLQKAKQEVDTLYVVFAERLIQ